MATYNRAHLVPETMDSVLGQDYPNLELLVVDDGSADATPQVLTEYAARFPEHQFRHVRQDNAGQARALNRGYALARGDIVGYMCDDDLLAPDAVPLQARALIADPEAAIAYSGYRVINESGDVEDTVRPIEYSPVDALRLHDTVIGPGGLVRRWALEASGGWVESMQWMADLVLWMDIGLRGRAIRLSEPLVSWRRHPGSVTVSLNADHAREHLTAYERGLALDGLPPLSEAMKAEGLRNACVFAAIFGGEGHTWPHDRFLVFDFHRKLISSEAAGVQAGDEPDWGEVERAARVYRELVSVAVELAHTRKPPPEASPAGAGDLEAIRRHLRAIGVLPRSDGSYEQGIEEGALRLGLLEAAAACGALSDEAPHRFAILDLERTRLSDDERARLESLGFVSSADDLAQAASDFRAELGRLRGAESSSRVAR